ncbi:MAG: hypothetical protein GY829_12790, partial [Gammaproteobacteria bacterium]|nr:hypothetical protein [Gammaproteobacteria bacterium]
MSEIRIIFQQIQHNLNNTVVNSPLTQQLIDTLRVGQNLTAQLFISDKQFWLIIDGVKLAIPKETVEQWQLVENQNIILKVKSLANPVELQIIKNAIQTSQRSNTALVDQAPASTKQELYSTKAAKVIEATVTSSIITKQPNIPNKSHTRLMANSSLVKIDTNVAAKPILSGKTNDNSISKQITSREKIQPSVTLQTSKSNQSKSKGSNSPLTQQNIKEKVKTTIATKSAGKLPNAKISDSIQNIIFASKKVISENNLQQTSSQKVSTNINSKVGAEPTITKPQSINNSQTLKIEQPEAKLTPLSVIKEPIKSNTKSTASSIVTNVNQTVVNNQASVSTQKMKFEIPVILPDKERFPLLADKLVAAFSQI